MSNNQPLKIELIQDSSELNLIEIFLNSLPSLITVGATLTAVYFAYKYNKKLESQKIKREKLELAHEIVYQIVR